MSSKFNIHWQLVRVNARAIKDPIAKLEYVMSFLLKHPNIHNYERVLNWIKMTAVGYKNSTPEAANLYDRYAKSLVSNANVYAAQEDMDNDLESVSRSDLLKVYNDLKARKYGFQFKSVPKAHTEFLSALEQQLGK